MAALTDAEELYLPVEFVVLEATNPASLVTRRLWSVVEWSCPTDRTPRAVDPSAVDGVPARVLAVQHVKRGEHRPDIGDSLVGGVVEGVEHLQHLS